MKNRTQISIPTNANGSCIVILNPYALTFSATGITTAVGGFGLVNSYAFPFVSVSTSATNLCYNGATFYPGPFNAQIPNITGFFPDQLKVSFISTQSALNAQGKITVGLYYNYPNVTF